MANVPLIDEGTGNGGGGVHDRRCPGLGKLGLTVIPEQD
jgi:hypothetical protein